MAMKDKIHDEMVFVRFTRFDFLNVDPLHQELVELYRKQDIAQATKD